METGYFPTFGDAPPAYPQDMATQVRPDMPTPGQAVSNVLGGIFPGSPFSRVDNPAPAPGAPGTTVATGYRPAFNDPGARPAPPAWKGPAYAGDLTPPPGKHFATDIDIGQAQMLVGLRPPIRPQHDALVGRLGSELFDRRAAAQKAGRQDIVEATERQLGTLLNPGYNMGQQMGGPFGVLPQYAQQPQAQTQSDAYSLRQ